jgi:hypothetical protein
MPSLTEMQHHFEVEGAILWFCLGLMCFWAPMIWWGGRYAMVHEHYPWMPERLDGSRGNGAFIWFRLCLSCFIRFCFHIIFVNSGIFVGNKKIFAGYYLKHAK